MIQKGKGFFTDLLKSTAKQALTAVTKTGLDENKRSLKDALKTHGTQAIRTTVRRMTRPPATSTTPLMARRGPKRIGTRDRPVAKKARHLDIFDRER